MRRSAGVRHAVDETAGAVTLLATVTDLDQDQATADQGVVDLLADRGSAIDAIVTTGYLPAIAAVRGVRASGRSIKIVGIDDDPLILDGIRDGSVAATVVQNPVGQAHAERGSPGLAVPPRPGGHPVRRVGHRRGRLRPRSATPRTRVWPPWRCSTRPCSPRGRTPTPAARWPPRTPGAPLTRSAGRAGWPGVPLGVWSPAESPIARRLASELRAKTISVGDGAPATEGARCRRRSDSSATTAAGSATGIRGAGCRRRAAREPRAATLRRAARTARRRRSWPDTPRPSRTHPR